MNNITFEYHSCDVAHFKRIGKGAYQGSCKVEEMGGGNGVSATYGAERLELPTGRYIAVQIGSDDNASIRSFSWIIDVEAPTFGQAKLVKS